MWIIALAVLLVLVAFGPPLKITKRAFNSRFRVEMPPRATHYAGRWDAVLGQEITEWWARWILAFILASPVIAALYMFTPFGLAAPILVLLAWQINEIPAVERQLEFIGWGAENLITPVEGIEDRMRRGYPEFFYNGDNPVLIDQENVKISKGLARWKWVSKATLVLTKFRRARVK